MAGSKIAALTAGTPKLTDLFVSVDVTDTSMAPSGTDKKYTSSDIKTFFLSGLGNMSLQNSSAVSITGGSIANAATTAISSNSPNTIMLRDGSGNVSATTFLGDLSGNAATSTTSGFATNSTTSVNFTGPLAGDVIGSQSSTVVANSAITNAKMANMNPLTLKGNNSSTTSGAPFDLSVAAVKTMLGITGSVSIANQQVAFGNSSSNIIGSNNIKWDDPNKKFLIPGAELNFGTSTGIRQVVLYSGFSDLNRYYGFSVESSQLQIHVDQTATDVVFLSGLTSSTAYESARIVGSGGIKLPSTNAIATEPFAFTGAPHTLTFTFTSPWSSARTHPFSFYRIGRQVIMSWPDLVAQTVATSGAIQSATANGSQFIPSIYYPAVGRPVQRITVYNNSTGSSGESGDIQFGSTTFGYNIVIRANNGSGFTTAAGFTAGSVSWFV